MAPLAISSCLTSALHVMLLMAEAQFLRTTGHSVLARSINAGITPSSASWTWFPCKYVPSCRVMSRANRSVSRLLLLELSGFGCDRELMPTIYVPHRQHPRRRLLRWFSGALNETFSPQSTDTRPSASLRLLSLFWLLLTETQRMFRKAADARFLASASLSGSVLVTSSTSSRPAPWRTIFAVLTCIVGGEAGTWLSLVGRPATGFHAEARDVDAAMFTDQRPLLGTLPRHSPSTSLWRDMCCLQSLPRPLPSTPQPNNTITSTPTMSL